MFRRTRVPSCIILPLAVLFPSRAPTLALRGCGFGHFGTTYPSRAGPPPFWGTPHTRRRAPKVLKIAAEGDKRGKRERGCGGDDTGEWWLSLFRNLTCSERKTVKEEVSFRGTLGLGKRLNFYRPPFRHVSPPRTHPAPLVPWRVHSLHASSHDVTFLVGASVPIFRRLLASFLPRHNLYRESL